MRDLTERESWRALRATRHQPRAAAADGPRRETYVAALQQAEELFDAARLLGPASRALPMFYGLSQAGRALCAASPRLTGDLEWQLQAHGISNPSLSVDLPDIKVAIKGEDKPGRKSLSFTGVSKALGSPLWQAKEAPTLRQLWDAIPEMNGHWFSHPPTQRPALAAEPVVLPELAGHPLVTAQVDVPDWLSLKPTDFPDFMQDYPAAADYIVVRDTPDGPPAFAWSGRDGHRTVTMSWNTGLTHPVLEVLRTARLYKTLVEYRGGWCILPRLSTETGPLHPLMTWWAVLYTLSMLTRYEPDRWTAIVNVNTSKLAVWIEHLLDSAQQTVPQLIVQALDSITIEP